MERRGGRSTSRARARRLAGLLAAIASLPLACDRPSPLPDPSAAPPRNVLLVSWDTTRDDAVGATRGIPLTPRLDALAAGGMRYRHAYGTATWTLPSHASLLTGLYPSLHGAVLACGEPYGFPLREDQETLAETLSHQGIRCGAVVSAPLLRRIFGLSRGFETWRDDGFRKRRPGEETTRLALDWLGPKPPEPFFLFVHYFDAHGPYGDPSVGPCPLADHVPAVEAWRTWTPRRRGSPRKPHTTGEAEAVRHLYAEGIHRLDRVLGELLDGLVSRGVWDRTAVIVTGDHGEELGHQGLWGHGYKMPTEAQLRVPLIVRIPPAWAPPQAARQGSGPGAAVEEPVDLTAVAPSVARLLGVRLPPALRRVPPLPGLELPGDAGEDTSPPAPRGGTPATAGLAISEAHWPAAERWTRCIHTAEGPTRSFAMPRARPWPRGSIPPRMRRKGAGSPRLPRCLPASRSCGHGCGRWTGDCPGMPRRSCAVAAPRGQRPRRLARSGSSSASSATAGADRTENCHFGSLDHALLASPRRRSRRNPRNARFHAFRSRGAGPRFAPSSRRGRR